MKLKVTARNDDYHACPEGKPEHWECGRTPAEAIGKLVMTHRELFDVTVEIKRAESPPPTIMPKINGETFRCENCGSNCFHREPERDHAGEQGYRCNGCGARYMGA